MNPLGALYSAFVVFGMTAGVYMAFFGKDWHDALAVGASCFVGYFCGEMHQQIYRLRNWDKYARQHWKTYYDG